MCIWHGPLAETWTIFRHPGWLQPEPFLRLLTEECVPESVGDSHLGPVSAHRKSTSIADGGDAEAGWMGESASFRCRLEG